MTENKLIGQILKVKDLTPKMIEEIFSLYEKYFFIKRESFDKNLKEKSWIILILDSKTNEIRGFSTMMLLKTIVQGKDIHAIFSGDTIVEEDSRNESVLMRMFARFTLELSKKYENLYWFLLSMGYRTYRFLPMFFYEFWPCFEKKTPVFEQKVIDTLSVKKFGDFYNPEKGIIYPQMGCHLKPEFAQIPTKRLKNPHVMFFLEKNLGYIKGDELASITALSKENFKPEILKRLGLAI